MFLYASKPQLTHSKIEIKVKMKHISQRNVNNYLGRKAQEINKIIHYEYNRVHLLAYT